MRRIFAFRLIFVCTFAIALILLLRVAFSIQARCTSWESAQTHEPLQLTLELNRPEARVGKRYSLWYRVSLKNVSCERIVLNANPFLKDASETLRITIWDSKGRAVPANSRPPSTDEYAPLIPYETTPAANPQLLNKIREYQRLSAEIASSQGVVAASAIAADNYVALLPGDSIQTTPSLLAPHFPELPPGFDQSTDNRDESRRIARAAQQYYEQQWKRRGSPTPPAAPQGFRPLDSAALFTTTGKYKIQAIFDDDIMVQPIFTIYDHLAWKAKSRLHFLEEIIGVRITPHETPRDHHLRITSSSLVFEVLR